MEVMPTRPTIPTTPATQAGIRPRDSTELADILAYRMREHLGATGDYTTILLPHRLAIQVTMRAPEELRGFSFIFTGEALPQPIRGLRNGMPVPEAPRYEHRTYRMAVTAPLPPATADAYIGANPNTGFNIPTTVNAPFTFNTVETIPLTEAEARWPRVRVVRTDAAVAADALMYGMLTPTGGTMATVTNNATFNVPLITPAIGVRTPEQEVRYQTLLEQGNRRIFTTAESEEYQALGRMIGHPTPVTPPPRPAPRVRVRVWRDDYGQWQVGVAVGGNNRDLPSVAVVKSLLPPGDKHFLPSRVGRHRSTLYALRTALESGLSAQSLHDALRAWIVAAEGAATNVQSDEPILDDSTAALLNAMPATLEVGGKVYRLVPTKELDARPLIKRVRERALSLARVEGEGIRTRARTDARVVVSEAEARASTLRMEVERERAAIGNRAPEWVVNSGRPHQYRDGYWYVEIKVLCRVREIRYTVSSWNRVLYWTPLNGDKPNSYYETWRMPVWVRLRPDGHYTKDDISCRGFCSTHIESYMCMELQGLPPAIQSAAHLTTLEGIVSRGMQVVNLNSPLSTNPKKYWPAFLEQIPPVPLKLMTSGERADRYIIPNGRTIERWQSENPSIVWDRSELIEQETATIFRVPEVGNATT